MAQVKFQNDVNLIGNQIVNGKAETLSSNPSFSAGDEARIIYNSTTKRFYINNGSSYGLVSTDSDNLGGNTPAYHLSRTNHTGQQAANTISDFDNQVRSSSLDQMAIPVANLDINGQKLINLAAGTNANDAVTKAQLDQVSDLATAAASGVTIKSPVKAASTTNITLSGEQTVDGVALTTGDRVLVAGQTASAENGIYVVSASSWSRSTDADDDGELAPGTIVSIVAGTGEGDTIWGLISDSDIVIGTTSQTWSRLVGGTSGFTTAGNGLTSSGTTVSVQAGNGIIADGSSTRVDPAIVARKATGIVPDGASTATITHNLNNEYPEVVVYEIASKDKVLVDTTSTGLNSVVLDFGRVITANEFAYTVIG